MKLYGNKSRERKHGGKRPRRARIAAALACVLGVIMLAVLGYMIWEAPPPVDTGGLTLNNPETPPPPSIEPDEPSPEPTIEPGGRSDKIWNILVAGRDKDGYNTDTIMLVSLNTEEHTVNVVSIPRDTMVNTKYNVKRINVLYSYSMQNGEGGAKGLVDGAKDLLGFSVDAYAIVSLDAFEDIIDAMGGVYFDVPVDMYYEAPDQNLSIAIDKGYQWLDGENALKVVRFRSGYADADIGRINTQQAFLKSVASQMLSLGNIPNLTKIIDIVVENLDTDLTAANISFLAREFLLCAKDGISTRTMPGEYNDSVGGFSYVTVDIDAWLDLVNEYINPWSDDVTEANVNILTRKNGMLYATSGVIAGGEDSFLTMEQYLASLRAQEGIE